jgi:hypothetical protein
MLTPLAASPITERNVGLTVNRPKDPDRLGPEPGHPDTGPVEGQRCDAFGRLAGHGREPRTNVRDLSRPLVDS